jgi:NTP pyrophosphatase (non-canonical NTP hydrolase)
MTRTDHLLTILAEECAEVSQRVTKALRFGIHEHQHGYAPNDERLLSELDDLYTAVKMLVDVGVLERSPHPTKGKEEQVERYFERSREMGRLA